MYLGVSCITTCSLHLENHRPSWHSLTYKTVYSHHLVEQTARWDSLPSCRRIRYLNPMLHDDERQPGFSRHRADGCQILTRISIYSAYFACHALSARSLVFHAFPRPQDSYIKVKKTKPVLWYQISEPPTARGIAIRNPRCHASSLYVRPFFGPRCFIVIIHIQKSKFLPPSLPFPSLPSATDPLLPGRPPPLSD